MGGLERVLVLLAVARVEEQLPLHVHAGEMIQIQPESILRDLDLRRPIYRQTAAYGHFGRPDLDLPWERTDKADLLRSEAGLRKQDTRVPAAS